MLQPHGSLPTEKQVMWTAKACKKKGTDNVVSTEKPSGCLAACNSWDQQGGNCRYCHTALIVNEHI